MGSEQRSHAHFRPRSCSKQQAAAGEEGAEGRGRFVQHKREAQGYDQTGTVAQRPYYKRQWPGRCVEREGASVTGGAPPARPHLQQRRLAHGARIPLRGVAHRQLGAVRHIHNRPHVHRQACSEGKRMGGAQQRRGGEAGGRRRGWLLSRDGGTPAGRQAPYNPQYTASQRSCCCCSARLTHGHGVAVGPAGVVESCGSGEQPNAGFLGCPLSAHTLQRSKAWAAAAAVEVNRLQVFWKSEGHHQAASASAGALAAGRQRAGTGEGRLAPASCR